MTDRTVKTRFEAQIGQWEAAMATMAASTKGVAKEIDGIGTRSKGSFKSMGMDLVGVGAGEMAVAAGAAVGAAALLKFGKAGVDSYTELAGQVRQFQRVTGESAEESSVMVARANALGVSADTLALGMFRLSKNVVSNADALKAAGVEVAHTKTGQVDLVGTMNNVADAYHRAGAGQQSSAVAQAAFGRGAVALLPLLAATKTQLDAIDEAARKHHEILTQEDLTKAREYKLAVHDLSEAWTGAEREMAQGAIPQLIGIARAMTGVIEQADDLSKKEKDLSTHVGAFANPLRDLANFTVLKPVHVAMDVLHGDVLQAVKDSVPFANTVLGMFSHHQSAAEAAIKQAEAEQRLQAQLNTVADQTGVSSERLRELAQEMGIDLPTAGAKEIKALADAAVKLNEAVTGSQKLEAVTGTLGDEFATTAEKIKAFDTAMAATLGNELDVDGATNTLRSSIQGLANDLATGQKQGETYAEYQERLQGDLVGVVRNIDATRKALVLNGQITEDAASQSQFMAAALSNVAAQYPALRGQIQHYIDLVMQIPGAKQLTVTADTSQAELALAQLRRDLIDTGNFAGNEIKAAQNQRAQDQAAFLAGIAVNSATSAIGAPAIGHVSEGAEKKAADEAKQQAEALAAYLEALWKQSGEVIRNEFVAGAIPLDELNRRLDEEIAREVPWTDRWVQLQKEKTDAAQLFASNLRAVGEMVRGFEDNQHEEGVISNEQYLALLRERLVGLTVFSNEWMAVWRQIQQVTKDAADKIHADAQAAFDKAAKARDDAFSKLNAELDQEQQIRKQMEDQEAQHYQRLADLQSSYIDSQSQLLEQRRQQLQGWAAIDQHVTVQWGNTVAALTGNVQDQFAQFNEWVAALDDARHRGVSEAVISMLGLDEGPAKLGQLRMFSSATQAEIDGLNTAVEQRTQQTNTEVTRESTAAYSALSSQLATMAAKYHSQVEAATADFLKQQRDDMAQLAAIGQDGARTFGDAIAQGLLSSIPAIVDAAKKAADALKRANDAQSKSDSTTPGASFVNPGTGRIAVTGPNGEAGLVNGDPRGAYIPGLVSWTNPATGTLTWYVPGQNIDPGNVAALNNMPHYAGGTDYVPDDGPAFLHRGERVVTALENAKLVAALGASAGGSSRPVMQPSFTIQVFDANGMLVTDERIRVVVQQEQGATGRARAVQGSRS